MRSELLTYRDPKSPVSEVFRTLRTNIQFMNTNNKLKTLLVTSTFPEEGKSWVTANLAVTFAQAGKKVILVDADMRKGRQYKIFDALPKPGLSNYLSNMDADDLEISNVNIVNYIQETGVDNLHVLVAGNVPPNPSELLVSKRMRELLKELREMCDLVIIDGTPCDLVTDSIILSRFVDSTIIVTAQKETKKDALQRITKNIQNVGGKIAGVVVNKVDMSSRKYKDTYYYGSLSGASLIETEDKKHGFGGLFGRFSSRDYDYEDEYEEDDDEKDNYEKDNRFTTEDTVKLNTFDYNGSKSKKHVNNEANDIVNSLFKDMKKEEEQTEAPIKEEAYTEPVEQPKEENLQKQYEDNVKQYNTQPQENYKEEKVQEQDNFKEEYNNSFKPQENYNSSNTEPSVFDNKTLNSINTEVQKLSEENQDNKTKEIIDIVNSYVQDELKKRDQEGMY